MSEMLIGIKEIVARCKGFEVYEERKVSDDYAELVMYTKEIDKWSEVFNEMLGGPVSPAGSTPSDDDVQMTQEYGGIFANQTLYKKEFPENTIIAMFWPWNDGDRITIKLASIVK